MVSAWYISLLPVCIAFDSSLHSVLDSLFFFFWHLPLCFFELSFCQSIVFSKFNTLFRSFVSFFFFFRLVLEDRAHTVCELTGKRYTFPCIIYTLIVCSIHLYSYVMYYFHCAEAKASPSSRIFSNTTHDCITSIDKFVVCMLVSIQQFICVVVPKVSGIFSRILLLLLLLLYNDNWPKGKKRMKGIHMTKIEQRCLHLSNSTTSRSTSNSIRSGFSAPQNTIAKTKI